MATGRTKPTFAAAILTYSGLSIIAITLLSVVVTLGVAFRDGVVGIECGELQALWKYDEYAHDFYTTVRGELHHPGIRFRWPTYEQSGTLGVAGWKTRYWMLRFPLWPICMLVVLRFIILVLGAPLGRRALTFRRLIRQFIGVCAALVIGASVAVGLSALATLIPENDLRLVTGRHPAPIIRIRGLLDVLLRIVIPLSLAAVPASLALRLICRDRRPVDARICPECGYNLTGNVTGRCPECGTAIAIPIIAPPKS